MDIPTGLEPAPNISPAATAPGDTLPSDSMAGNTLTPGTADETFYGVPKTIWIMWVQGLAAAPPVVKACHDSWRQLNPDWNVVFLDETNLEHYLGAGFLSRYRGVAQQAFSDLVRINLLARYGGIWTDATCYCQRPLADWLGDKLTSGFFAFAWTGDTYRVARELSMWFLASSRGNQLVQGWRDAANSYWAHNPNLKRRPKVGRYFEWLSRSPRTTQYWFSYPLTKVFKIYPYFWMSFLFNDVIRRDARARQIWQATPKLDTEVPHHIKRVGQLSPLTASLKEEIDARQVPMYKLNWRYNEVDYTETSVLHYLLSSGTVQSQAAASSD